MASSRHQQPPKCLSLDSLVLQARARQTRNLYASRRSTLSSPRTVIRIVQALTTLAAFATLMLASYPLNFFPASIYQAQLPLLIAICVTSMVTSMTQIFNYLFPRSVSIPPHRQHTFSWVEIAFDGLLTCLWLSAAVLAIVFYYYGPRPFGWMTRMNTEDPKFEGYCPSRLYAIEDTAEFRRVKAEDTLREEFEILRENGQLQDDCAAWLSFAGLGIASAMVSALLLGMGLRQRFSGKGRAKGGAVPGADRRPKRKSKKKTS